MFIIDFDDTLFDTQALKQARLEAVQQLGISEDEFWTTYRQARNSLDGAFTYSNERHADVLAGLGYNRTEVLTQLAYTTGVQLHEFLFPDTISFLEELRGYGQSMILLSLGNPGFQELKTTGVGVQQYFDRVFMVHDTKRHVLADLFAQTNSDEKLWFINDKVEETRDLAQEFSGMQPILKVSERFDENVYEQSGLPFFHSLTEIARYIRSHVLI